MLKQCFRSLIGKPALNNLRPLKFWLLRNKVYGSKSDRKSSGSATVHWSDERRVMCSWMT
jgi:hypothetical protein